MLIENILCYCNYTVWFKVTFDLVILISFVYRSKFLLIVALLPPAIIHGIVYWGLWILIIRNMIYGVPSLLLCTYIMPYFNAFLLLHGVGHAYFVASRCPSLKQQWKDWIRKWIYAENQVHPSPVAATVVQRNTGERFDHFEILERAWNTTTPTKCNRKKRICKPKTQSENNI